MKKVFVDTNIIVDLLADRRPHSKFAIELFKKAEQNEVELFTSSHSTANPVISNLAKRNLKSSFQAFTMPMRIVLSIKNR